MEAPDRSQATRRSGGADLFICFAPRRPSRTNLRLRTSRSVKGAQSPAIFPSMNGGRKKSSSFEATAEPSSPKVSCIGQVRVKTGMRRKKKAAGDLRSRSRRVGNGKDANFRRGDDRELDRVCFPSKNQSWVHLPLGNICEGIRAFGSDLNCFKSCRSAGGEEKGSSSSSSWCCSCSCSCGLCGKKKGRRKRARMCSCKTAFAKCWVMEIEDGEVNVRREEDEIKVVEKEEERDLVVVMRERGSRRGMRELELLADELEKGKLKIQEEEEQAPACVPPKNALLLMRCRSDPTRMSSLATTRFVEPEVATKLVLEEPGKEHVEEPAAEREKVEGRRMSVDEKDPQKIRVCNGEIEEKDCALPLQEIEEEVEKENKDRVREAKKKGIAEKAVGREGGEREERRRSFKKDVGGGGMARRSTSYREGRRSSFSTEGDARRVSFEKEGKRRWSFSSEKDARRGEGKVAVAVPVPVVVETQTAVGGEGEKSGELPDCLLLMMYEPKLSMEVSKETWVCTADFLKWQPHHRRRQQQGPQQDGNAEGAKAQAKEETSTSVCEIDARQTDVVDQAQPLPPKIPQSEPRKVATSANVTVETTYGPFTLMRCKSEPVRSSASGQESLDGCFWRSRHQPVSAGIGF